MKSHFFESRYAATFRARSINRLGTLKLGEVSFALGCDFPPASALSPYAAALNSGCCPDSSTQTTSRGETFPLSNSRALFCQSSNNPLNRISIFLGPNSQIRVATTPHSPPLPAPQTTPTVSAPTQTPSPIQPNPVPPPPAKNPPSSQTPSPFLKTRAVFSNPPAATCDTAESTKSSKPSDNQSRESAATPPASLD